ncbi:MAG: DUF2993 domain-containing protein [Synergistaceae bacterium]|jgi:hypothetical protein|nr:DUF2993 domain-containing protein [Synergistaceae bacterium]
MKILRVAASICSCMFLFVLCALFALPAVPAWAADFEFKGEIKAQDPTSRLLAHYVDAFTPEDLFLIIDEQPDDTGRFRDLYMDLTGVLIDGVRVDKLTFRMNDVQFNPPSEWAAGNVECGDALQIYARCLLKEDDINRKLASETFGKDDHWQNISMKISADGLSARGTYVAKILFVALNILIEVDSDLKILENRELWLDDYKVRVNALDVPDYITRKAIAQIQPLLDLGNFPLPLKLHKVEFQEGQAALSTRILPNPIEGGITYRYRAE